ncbi:universal stress protein [Arthrobacter sp. Soil762]|uniref:universal stress protein n=1 Tax=Arthrobacter sp. Soil762 TaxID=1736401 RepID=UPI0006F1EAA1|nr:universal stress protein [Arthrobacter sp. Soil762]KRE80423.1 universal stress protein UspA [Arthrobacter sp. Soil762]
MATGRRRGLIIVGVDGSAASIEALRQATRLAVVLGTHVQAWACWDFPAGFEAFDGMGTEGFTHEAAESLQHALAEAFGPEVPRNVTTRLVRGAPRPSLIDASKNASLLVVGRRGRGGFRELLLGSVTTACVAHAHCPVLVVPPLDPGRNPLPPPRT